MELTDELRERIRNYFDNITAEELYDILVNEYGFEVETTDNNEQDNDKGEG